MNSGIYLVTLNNEQPISVNANDPRIAHKAIKVTRANCKLGRAKNLEIRKRNYEKTFGAENVNFRILALTANFEAVEKQVLKAVDVYRIRGRTGRKNEWLEGITPDQAVCFAHRAMADLNIVPLP